MQKKTFFPDMITDLPQADIPIEGLQTNCLQCKNKQIIFMDFKQDIEVPKHSHEAQWGIVLDGEMELTIGGCTKIFKTGDTYFIPKNIKHSAKIKSGYKDLTLFNQKDRYKLKNNYNK